MSAVPQIRAHRRTPDMAEIEREQRGAAIILLGAIIGAILIVSFCIGSLIWAADLPPMHLEPRP